MIGDLCQRVRRRWRALRWNRLKPSVSMYGSALPMRVRVDGDVAGNQVFGMHAGDTFTLRGVKSGQVVTIEFLASGSTE